MGRTDLVINVKGEELLIETKIFYHELSFETGKKQLAYYCRHLGLNRGIYLVFIKEQSLKLHHETIFENIENIDGVEIYSYLVEYGEDTPEYRASKPRKKKK